ncbi:MAG: hypothetical protein M3466_20225, partial [Gemmatimonadota bacterium]|nr:hypothetical protein [Gemmatimonadota bacterium]
MVVSYWDMAAALVTFESIDEEMFNAINTEHVVVFAKLQPFLAEIRAVPGVHRSCTSSIWSKSCYIC